MMRMYSHYTLIPKMLEVMSNGISKAKLLENYCLTALFQETVGQWIIKIGFKYNYAVNDYYVGGHKNKDMISYRYNFIDCCLLLENCMFVWIQMTSEDPQQYKGYKIKSPFKYQASITRDATQLQLQ